MSEPAVGAANAAVVAVVVTWNRRGLLLEALAAVTGQTRPPERLVVVDNASTDGTSAAVASGFPRAELITTASNLGGAGGFALGIARALADGPADLLWLMDDDTVPEPGALERLLAARDGYPGPAPALVASRVVWTDGRDHPMNTPRTRPFAPAGARAAAASVGALPVRSASFVSVLLDASACRGEALPVADYFLWNDDFEYTARLLRRRVGLYLPASVVVHRTRTFGATGTDPGPRFFYEVRNKVWLLTRSPALAPWERVLYAGVALGRWARTLLRGRRRAELLGGLLRGVGAGVVRGPRPTGQLLAGHADRAA